MGLESLRNSPTARSLAAMATLTTAVAPAITACSGPTEDECIALIEGTDRRGFPFDSDLVAYSITEGDQAIAAFDVPNDDAAIACQLPFRAQVYGNVWMIAEGDTEPTLHYNVPLSEDPITISDVGPAFVPFDTRNVEDFVTLRVRVQLPDGTTIDTPDTLINTADPLAGTEFPATAEPGEGRGGDNGPDDLPDPYEAVGGNAVEE